MSPDERQMLAGLFDRIRAASGTPRDRDAEALINQAIVAQPYAPYLLAQTVLVQEETLKQAAQRVQQLEAQVTDLQSRAAAPQESGSFLGGIGKSLFGSPAPVPRPTPVPQYAQPYTSQPQQAGGPWGNQPQQQYAQPPMMGQMAPRAGGGFLSGALSTAAGVAGGVMLAESLGGLFGGHHGGMGGSMFGGGGSNSGVNSYETDHTQDQLQDQLADADTTQDALQDANDYGSGGDSGGGDSGSSDV